MAFYHLHRIYSNIILSENIVVNINDAQHQHYLKTVLRLKINDQFRIFNGEDGEYLAQILRLSKNSLEVKILHCLRKPIKEPELTLGLCLIKIDRMLEAINMAVQLGVTEVVPLFSTRSQLRSINHQRFLKCIIEATEQSERISVPSLRPLISLSDYIAQASEMIIYANEKENSANTVKFIKHWFDRISVIIGPEGGFIEAELKMLIAVPGSISISLGNNVLRTETAVATAIAQVQLMREKLCHLENY
ncbi:Ribosomal RNA small subunit methyltransferase E [Candidatus Trichorickettsia mobilis]|uniref:Ribosomal RNA small subunit methyltransferase E n=1 Tax=Candidatus Trichorickettsia mobilis TaxID=1346319 RepID=A0ABZ0URI8_9RICK|nr:16S rRNA (uracil(1498)-N(3))-methyltransferase [Candidatus Trichorickettsia mobilis]WPY00226.1 Ribosomal RNA small subunit methyltransferase E [Candidatus Trichorickettsia mobilis]